MGTKVEREVVHSRRTDLRSVSARAKKRFPVRVQRRTSHRRFALFFRFFHFFSVSKDRTKLTSFVSVAHLVVLH